MPKFTDEENSVIIFFTRDFLTLLTLAGNLRMQKDRKSCLLPWSVVGKVFYPLMMSEKQINASDFTPFSVLLH